MQIGDTLATLIEEVQYEVGHVVSPAAGQNFREHIKARIRREYRRLYHEHNWRHLRRWGESTTLSLNAGQRYYDYPAGLDVTNVMGVYVRWGYLWNPVEDNLDPLDYNAFNSDIDVRTDPVQKWRPYTDTQFEVWPVPATTGTKLRLVNKEAFQPLVNEDDRCRLDTDLVVLFAAAPIAARQNDKDGGFILARAEKHYETLKLKERGARRRTNLAAGGQEKPSRIGFRDKIITGVERG